jgi:hypothetical protein
MGIFQQYGFHHECFGWRVWIESDWTNIYKWVELVFSRVLKVQQKWLWQMPWGVRSQLLLLGIHHSIRNDPSLSLWKCWLMISCWGYTVFLCFFFYPNLSVIDWRSSLQKNTGNPYVDPFNLGWFDMMGWKILIKYMIFHCIFMVIIYEVINLKLCFDLHFPLVNFHILLWKDPPLMGKSTN